MSSKESEKVKKHICLGILAHVDAGKTTLSESMLYISGSIRKMGRVDHKDAFLDTYDLERSRGITIFSKQAVLSWKDMGITLLDTPRFTICPHGGKVPQRTAVSPEGSQ